MKSWSEVKYNQIGHSIYLYSFSNRNLNLVGQLFGADGKLKSWECIKHQFLLKNNMQFQYWKIIHALPQHWKETIKHLAGNLNNLHIQDYQLRNTIYSLEKLNSSIICNCYWNMKNLESRLLPEKVWLMQFQLEINI